MNRWMDARSWLLAFAMTLFAFCAQSEELAAQERYDALIRTIDAQSGRPREERVAALAAAYDTLFPMSAFQHLEQVDDQALATTFIAAANAVRLIGRPDDVRQAELAFDELLSREIASELQFSYMQGAYIQTRMLDKARRFHAQNPSAGLNPVPVVHESERLPPGQPTELVLSPDGAALFRRSVEISDLARVVVIAHPRCHFSRDAMLAIEADPILSAALREAKWLMPPGFRFDMDAVQHWNRAHPAITLGHAYQVDEWPQIDGWGTPTFYFFRNGSLETKVTGWPKGGRRDELLAALREVGLLPAAE